MVTITNVAALSARVSDKTVWTFVRVDSSDGRSGWGEATLQGCAPAVHAHVAQLKPALLGRKLTLPIDVMDIVGTCGRDNQEAAAISALDQAIWDVASQEHGKPLANVLGAFQRSTIGLYANVNRGTLDRSPAGFAARAREAARRGFDAVKIAPFDGLQPDKAGTTEGAKTIRIGIERIAAVRAAIGANVQLLVDCHWRLDEAAAHQVLRELESLNLYWLESPLAETPANFPALRRLRERANRTGVRLAGCEMMIGRDGFQPFLDAGVYDVIMPDVKYAGGLRELLRIGEAAARCGVACSLHNPSGPIAHAHSLHLSAHLVHFPFLEFQYAESSLFFEFVAGDMPDPNAGRSDLPQGAGLGLGLGGSPFNERRIDVENAGAVREAIP